MPGRDTPEGRREEWTQEEDPLADYALADTIASRYTAVMNKAFDYLLRLGDAEFSGQSFNGPSLIETLKSLSVSEAASTDTYEGYSAWGAALHVLYYKHLVGRALNADLPKYNHEENGWPSLPDDRSEESYNAMITELESLKSR